MEGQDKPNKLFISHSRKDSQRESARWVEALDWLVSQNWVKSAGYKGEVYRLTGTGYKMADMLKDRMEIDTNVDPLIELKEFE